MELVFASRKLAKLCNSQKDMRADLGARCAEKLALRLAQLQAAASLQDISLVPVARCHELSGDRKGQLAVDLLHPRRPIFVPNHDPCPELEHGGLDWSRVTQIVIVQIVDYH